MRPTHPTRFSGRSPSLTPSSESRARLAGRLLAILLELLWCVFVDLVGFGVRSSVRGSVAYELERAREERKERLTCDHATSRLAGCM